MFFANKLNQHANKIVINLFLQYLWNIQPNMEKMQAKKILSIPVNVKLK